MMRTKLEKMAVALGLAALGILSTGCGEEEDWAVLVRGTLSAAETAQAQQKHDPLAAGGEARAKELGDFGHDAMVGSDLLGTTPDQFLGIDRWDNTEGLDTFYSDPDFQAGFATLFSAPPTVEQFVRQADWVSWGSMTAGDAFNPHYFVVVRGRLKEADPEKARKAHDEVAGGGQAQAIAAGDVAHVVFTGREDPREFLAVDIWKSADNIVATYTDPAQAQAFGSLFEGTPTLQVYVSTSWHQW